VLRPWIPPAAAVSRVFAGAFGFQSARFGEAPAAVITVDDVAIVERQINEGMPERTAAAVTAGRLRIVIDLNYFS